jgi:hypothetical protein
MNIQNSFNKIAKLWPILVFVVILWLLLSTASYFLLALPRNNAFDFYPRWVGSRATLVGENPYSDEVTWRIQEGMFGRRLQPWEDQQRFAYFPLVTWLLLPFWLLPFPFAISLWSGLQLLFLLVLPLVVIALLGWRVHPVQLVLLLIFSTLAYRYPINAYLIGQFTPWCLTSLVISWWGLANHRPVIAYMALMMALVRPEITLLPMLALILLAWQMNYRGIVLALGGSVGILLILTRLWVGPWEKDFILGLRSYQQYSAPIWPPGLLNNHLLVILFLMAIMTWMAWMWMDIRRTDQSEQGVWVLSVSTLVSLIVLPQTGNYHLIMGLLAAWLVLWVSKGNVWLWLGVLIVLSSPWLFLLGGEAITPWEHLWVPVFLIVLLSISWMIRKNRFQIILGATRTTTEP